MALLEADLRSNTLVLDFLTHSLVNLIPPQTREQEELEELLLLEQQGNEQRRLEVLQEEQRQLQAKRKNKQALLDELVRNPHVACSCIYRMLSQVVQEDKQSASRFMADVWQTHAH